MINHPLPKGTKVLADISCKHCNLGYEDEVREVIQPVEIKSHTVQDGIIRYKVTGIPISQFILAEHIKEVIE